MRTVHKDMSVS